MDPISASLHALRTPELRDLQARYAPWGFAWWAGQGLVYFGWQQGQEGLLFGGLPLLVAGTLGGLGVQARAIGVATGSRPGFPAVLGMTIVVNLAFQVIAAILGAVGAVLVTGLGAFFYREEDALMAVIPTAVLLGFVLMGAWSGIWGLAVAGLGRGGFGQALTGALGSTSNAIGLGVRWVAWWTVCFFALLAVSDLSANYRGSDSIGFFLLVAILSPHFAIAFIVYVAAHLPEAAPVPVPVPETRDARQPVDLASDVR